MQQWLKSPPRSAHARIVAAELLAQFLVAVDDAVAALDARLGRVAPTALAGPVRRES